MALGLTQPITEMNSRNVSGCKGGRYVELTTLPPSCADCLESGSFNLLEFSGPLQVCNGIALPQYYFYMFRHSVAPNVIIFIYFLS
jgi:hypothetical protein